MTVGITPAMRDFLLVVQELTAAGASPSFAEIGHELGVCKSEVFRLVALCEERGRISRWPGQARSLAVIDPPPMPDECEVELTAAGVAMAAIVAAEARP